ncbi:MAG: hypothetical protein HC854_03025 [Flavobacterium sp.]|nr:hypothetical protein [Flavobacterium sp.]
MILVKNNIITLCITVLTLISCNSKKVISNKQIDEVTKKQDSLAFELCQIYGLDQGVRLSEGFPNKMMLVQNIDSLCFKRVINFIKINGYPTDKILGERNYKQECVPGSVIAVLLHNPHRLVREREYFELLLNEVKKGNLKPESFATILDKYYWTKSKNKETRRVFYGSQFGKPCIQTKDETNKARVEIGLKPLNDDEFVDCEGEELDMPKERK